MNIVDLDTRIVERAGMSISEIFDIQKEKGFRQIEHEHVVELSKMETENMIIATGGGAPCFHDNMGRL